METSTGDDYSCSLNNHNKCDTMKLVQEKFRWEIESRHITQQFEISDISENAFFYHGKYFNIPLQMECIVYIVIAPFIYNLPSQMSMYCKQYYISTSINLQ